MFLFTSQSSIQAGQTQQAWNAWFSVNKFANGTNWTGTVLMIFNNFKGDDATCAATNFTSAELEIYITLKHGSNFATYHGETARECVSINPAEPGGGSQGDKLQEFITEFVEAAPGSPDWGLGGTCHEGGCLTSVNNATIGLSGQTPHPDNHPDYWFFADVGVAIQ